MKRSEAKSRILHLKKKTLFEPIVILAISIFSDFWMFACVQKVYILWWDLPPSILGQLSQTYFPFIIFAKPFPLLSILIVTLVIKLHHSYIIYIVTLFSKTISSAHFHYQSLFAKCLFFAYSVIVWLVMNIKTNSKILLDCSCAVFLSQPSYLMTLGLPW